MPLLAPDRQLVRVVGLRRGALGFVDDAHRLFVSRFFSWLHEVIPIAILHSSVVAIRYE